MQRIVQWYMNRQNAAKAGWFEIKSDYCGDRKHCIQNVTFSISLKWCRWMESKLQTMKVTDDGQNGIFWFEMQLYHRLIDVITWYCNIDHRHLMLLSRIASAQWNCTSQLQRQINRQTTIIALISPSLIIWLLMSFYNFRVAAVHFAVVWNSIYYTYNVKHDLRFSFNLLEWECSTMNSNRSRPICAHTNTISIRTRSKRER